MDFLVILACIGAIGAGITIWKAISSSRNGDEDSGHIADADALEAGVVRYLFDALKKNHSESDFAVIVAAASNFLKENGSIVEIEYDENTGVIAVMHPEERTGRYQHTVPSKSPQYLRRLTSVLPKTSSLTEKK